MTCPPAVSSFHREFHSLWSPFLQKHSIDSFLGDKKDNDSQSVISNSALFILVVNYMSGNNLSCRQWFFWDVSCVYGLNMLNVTWKLTKLWLKGGALSNVLRFRGGCCHQTDCFCLIPACGALSFHIMTFERQGAVSETWIWLQATAHMRSQLPHLEETKPSRVLWERRSYADQSLPQGRICNAGCSNETHTIKTVEV